MVCQVNSIGKSEAFNWSVYSFNLEVLFQLINQIVSIFVNLIPLIRK